MKLTPLQRELLLALYEPMRRYRTGDWNFANTVWSKATFTLAKSHGKLRPSPARGRNNMARDFESRLTHASRRLVSLDLASWRNVRAPEAPARVAQGYKRHKARSRDLFLTEAGLAMAEALMRTQGLMAESEQAGCSTALSPRAPVADGLTGCDD